MAFTLFLLFRMVFWRQETKYRIKRGEYEKAVDSAIKGMVRRTFLYPIEEKLNKASLENIPYISKEERILLLKYMYYLKIYYGENFSNRYLLSFVDIAEKEENVEMIRKAAEVVSSKEYKKFFNNKADIIEKKK